MAGVEDEMAKLSFDLTCAYRLVLHDNECRKGQAKLIAYEVSKLFADGEK